MSRIRGIGAIALVAVLLLAGCSAGTSGAPGTTAVANGPAGTDHSPSATGSLAFYVSDRPAAIDDFTSLSVTVTEIGVHRAGPDGTNWTRTTAVPTDSPTSTGTNANATPAENGTTTDVVDETPPTTTTEGAVQATGTEAGSSVASDGGWIRIPVDDVTVDLTRLQGANASRIADAGLPAGRYTGVYVQVSNVTGTLSTGETVRVSLPSDRLTLHRGFALAPNGSTSFVFDVAVHRAGGSGKYVLRPVIGASGPDVAMTDVTGKRHGDSAVKPTPTEQPSTTDDHSTGEMDGEHGPPAGAPPNGTTGASADVDPRAVAPSE